MNRPCQDDKSTKDAQVLIIIIYFFLNLMFPNVAIFVPYQLLLLLKTL